MRGSRIGVAHEGSGARLRHGREQCHGQTKHGKTTMKSEVDDHPHVGNSKNSTH